MRIEDKSEFSIQQEFEIIVHRMVKFLKSNQSSLLKFWFEEFDKHCLSKFTLLLKNYEQIKGYDQILKKFLKISDVPQSLYLLSRTGFNQDELKRLWTLSVCLDQKLTTFNRQQLKNLDEIIIKFLQYQVDPTAPVYRVFAENIVKKDKRSLKKFTQLLQNFDQFVQYERLQKKFSELKDPFPLLLYFWSEELQTQDLIKLWQSRHTTIRKYNFLMDLILSNKIELVSKLNEDHFNDLKNQQDKNGNLLAHYAAIRGNSNIYDYVLVQGQFSFLHNDDIISTLNHENKKGYFVLDYVVMHEEPRFVREVFGNIKMLGGPFYLSDYGWGFSYKQLKNAANIEILKILLDEYDYFLENPRNHLHWNREHCFKEMTRKEIPLEKFPIFIFEIRTSKRLNFFSFRS